MGNEKMKCPYCARPLRRGSFKCRACRRYVFEWPHLVVLGLLGIVAIVALIEIFLRFT